MGEVAMGTGIIFLLPENRDAVFNRTIANTVYAQPAFQRLRK
jgi:hypothetical protein